MKNEMEFAANLARKAGNIIRDNFGLAQRNEWKKDNTPVTKTDKTINSIVLYAVKRHFPDYNVLAEEGSFFTKNSEYTWVCDPLDGTVAFSRGIPTTTFILSLVKNGKSVLGVIYEPYLDWLFTAEEGKGAFLNGNKISSSSRRGLKNSAVAFSTRKEHRINLLKTFEALKNDTFVFTLGSAGYMGALVACGKLDAYITSIRNPYEAAALKIIVEEAGGKMTDIFGEEQRYDREIKGFLASNNLLHKRIIGLIK